MDDEGARDRLDAARAAVDCGASAEDVIAQMRRAGASVVETIIAMVRLGLAADLGQAKPLVHLSHAWADQRAAFDALHDQLERAVDDER